jgi:hypothetical protein
MVHCIPTLKRHRALLRDFVDNDNQEEKHSENVGEKLLWRCWWCFWNGWVLWSNGMLFLTLCIMELMYMCVYMQNSWQTHWRKEKVGTVCNVFEITMASQLTVRFTDVGIWAGVRKIMSWVVEFLKGRNDGECGYSRFVGSFTMSCTWLK